MYFFLLKINIKNLWDKEETIGEMSGNKHAFYFARFLKGFEYVLAYTYNGAFYLWKYNYGIL